MQRILAGRADVGKQKARPGIMADLFFGTTVHRVRHTVQVPVLLLRHR